MNITISLIISSDRKEEQMYTLLINENKEVIATHRETIMQRDKLVNKLQVLCPRMFNGLDVSQFDLAMMYRLPISHDLKLVILTLNDTDYKEEYCNYILDIDTDITSENGDVEITFQFMSTELSDTGENIERVQGIKPTTIHICELADWLALSDSALNTLAQLYLNNKNMLLAQDKLLQDINNSKLDDIKIDPETGKLIGVSNGNETGIGVDLEELANDLVDRAGDSEGNVKVQIF